jgi:hypothetical protein
VRGQEVQEISSNLKEIAKIVITETDTASKNIEQIINKK